MTRFLTLVALGVVSLLAQPAPTPQNLSFEDGQPGNAPLGWRVPASVNGYTAKLSSDNPKFALALDKMLSALHDPATHVIAPRKESPRWVMRTETAGDSVHVVRFVSGTNADAISGRQSFTKFTANGGPVVFDLRGMGQAVDMLNYTVPLAATSNAPPRVKRVHWGYAAQSPTGYQGYYSAWETRDGQRRAPSQSSPIRPVFLVDAGTPIPEIAVEAQYSGTGAILSEGPMHGDQLAVRQIPVGNLSVAVRTEEIAYRDGTTGLRPNLVLNQTGEDALKAAIEIAKQGEWPKAPPKEKLNLPPAVFQEKTYIQGYPSAELRMLAAARIWGVFQYFHPYKYLYGEDWDAVLADFLPKMAAAKDRREYNLTVAEMVTHTHDTHCYITSAELNSYQGVPSAVEVRWIEEQPVVTRVLDAGLDTTVQAGDVITKLNGEPIQKRIGELSHLFSVSNDNSLHMRVMQVLLNGPANVPANVTLRGADGKERDVSIKRDTAFYRQLAPSRAGDSYRLLSPKIGYVDLDKLTNAQVDAMFDTFQGTAAIIMDMRGYPQGTAWSIAPRLATQPGMVNAQFRTNIVTTGGESAVKTEIEEQTIPLTNKPRYKGKTVLLIDDRAMSQSEHSGLMYKTANGTVFIGSGTAGANGDVTSFPVPGAIQINFSGHDVRWPDGKQLQRVGLIPDIEVKPTIAGIRSGRDEILERALAYLASGDPK